MTITFVGHGYVGIVTACVFADLGNTVYVIGRTPEKIKKLEREKALKELLAMPPTFTDVKDSVEYIRKMRRLDEKRMKRLGI